MRRVDASRADFRGASLADVAVHGARLRRTKCEYARMAGMWSGPYADERPEVKAGKDGTMPPMEPLEATRRAAVEWAKEKATPVDTAKDGEEDAQDEAAWAAHKQALQDKRRLSEERWRPWSTCSTWTPRDATALEPSRPAPLAPDASLADAPRVRALPRVAGERTCSRWTPSDATALEPPRSCSAGAGFTSG